MDVENLIYPPNKPLERILLHSEEPILYDYLSVIDINDKGEIILGSSNVSAGYWESSLFFYKDGTAALTNDYFHYFTGATSISDAIFIPNTTKILLAEDTFSLKLLDIDNSLCLKCEDFFYTNALVQQLSSWHTNEKIVSCADTQISIWNFGSTNTSQPITEFKNVHTDIVRSVSVNKNENNLFATASMDRKSCIWDDRMKSPATVLYQNDFCGLTSVAWNPKHSQYVVIGSKGGEIYNVDIRQLKEFLANYHCFDSSIHRMKFNDSGNLAVCGGTTDVITFSCEDNFQVIRNMNTHLSYVRGLAWFHDTLYSCGFDKQIIKHEL
ncbi:hypothetical protein RI129_010871 [Pyrocoelia pectoralis]|uniref:Uncharacterized protein n=1 Tax=Pyrocoelia pectoralis TaxID=417401 RepID=A0AAN7UZQ2_9COLE